MESHNLNESGAKKAYVIYSFKKDLAFQFLTESKIVN